MLICSNTSVFQILLKIGKQAVYITTNYWLDYSAVLQHITNLYSSSIKPCRILLPEGQKENLQA